MTEPIKAGDMCEVIDGMNGQDSPNIGLIVIVRMFVGEHSQYGRMWRCEAEFAEAGQELAGVPGDLMDFAQTWLKKLPPKGQPPEQKVVKKDLELEKS